MAEKRVQRRLAAILAADVVGYSRLMGEDEAGTRAQFNAHLNERGEAAHDSRSRFAYHRAIAKRWRRLWMTTLRARSTN